MSNFTYIPDQPIVLVDAVPDYRQLVPSTTEFVRSYVRGVVKPAKATRKEILRRCASEQHSECGLARCEGDDGVVCACACHAGEDSISNFYLWDNSWLVDVSHDSHRAWWHRGTLARTPYAVTYVRSHPCSAGKHYDCRETPVERGAVHLCTCLCHIKFEFFLQPYFGAWARFALRGRWWDDINAARKAAQEPTRSHLLKGAEELELTDAQPKVLHLPHLTPEEQAEDEEYARARGRRRTPQSEASTAGQPKSREELKELLLNVLDRMIENVSDNLSLPCHRGDHDGCSTSQCACLCHRR